MGAQAETADFLRTGRSPLDQRAPPVGFCFSFPVKQSAVAAGKVATLTKKFSNEGLVGSDPVQMLQSALRRLHAPVRSLAHPPCPPLKPLTALHKRLNGPLACCSLADPVNACPAPCTPHLQRLQGGQLPITSHHCLALCCVLLPTPSDTLAMLPGGGDVEVH